MKLIVAIIRPDKLNDVLESLYRAEVRDSPSRACSATAARPTPWRPTAARR
jgi:hypothetical protein